MPLSLAPLNTILKVTDISAGCGLSKRLADMGIIPGVELKLVGPQAMGPVIIDLKGSRVALGKGLAQRIMVTEKLD